MDEIIKIMFGDYTMIQLFGFIWFFIIGYIAYGLVETSGRDVLCPATPVKWSWKFWFLDNWRRYITTFICSYILFRFSTEISGHPFGNYDSVLMGVMGDGIAATVKKRLANWIGANRPQIMKGIRADNNNEGAEK